MIETGIDRRIKLQDILPNQLPKFILEESPLTSDFLQQYYISQEFQGGPIDLTDNLDQYLNVDNLTPDIVVGFTTLTTSINSTDTTIEVSTTKGFPNKYGLFKIDNEIISYTGITTDSFTGCIRGFSGITSYHQDLNYEELIFNDSVSDVHTSGIKIQNLSSLFLQEFYKKIKYTFTPGLEDRNFHSGLDVGNFIKEARSLYQTKGTDESFRILFNVLYNHTPTVVNLEDYLIKPSSASYVRRQIAIAEVISGDPIKLKGQSLFGSDFSNDINASVSEVEAFTRNNKQYFKFSLFLGYDNYSDLKDDFVIVPNTKSIETVSIGSSIISVDSTIGFNAVGTILSGINTITYTDKSVNQFLNCSWVDEDNSAEISPSDNLRSDKEYYGYEDGDITKEVKLRFTGVLSEFVQEGIIDIAEGDLMSVKSIGDKVSNPINKLEKTRKQIFANSWIYNTSSTYNVKSFEGQDNEGTLTVYSPIDRSSLKVGDRIEIINSITGKLEYPLSSNDVPYVSEEIENQSTTISLSNFNFVHNPELEYSLRRKLNKANASTSSAQINFGNGSLVSDIQNVYFDDQYGYVTSNSLPSYHDNVGTDEKFPYLNKIDTPIKKIYIDLSNNVGIITDITSEESFSSIIFPNDIPFITGDQVFYKPTESSLVGLDTGIYSIEKLSSSKIRLYASNSGIGGTDRFITFNKAKTNDGVHNFTLLSHKSELIGDQKLFKKFPINSNLSNGIGDTTNPGGIGMMINGVEICNYKSRDKIYYGPLDRIDVLNGGENFDVINLPKLTISNPTPISGSGTTALVQPVVSGSIKEVFVDSQDFDIDTVISIGVTGGNGTGCILKPILNRRYREVEFDGRQSNVGGGINTALNTVLFQTDHGFVDGQQVTYDSDFNTGIGIGIGNTTLLNNGIYFAKKINNRTIKLFNSSSDYSSGINTIDLNGANTSGFHKFKVGPKNTLSAVNIIDPGKNYTNRKLIVKPTGISTIFDTITFDNHGFNDGDIVEYSFDGTSIVGLTTITQYKVIKVSDDKFRLADDGQYPIEFEFRRTNRLTSHTYVSGATSWQQVDNASTDNGFIGIWLRNLKIGAKYRISLRIDNNAVLDTTASYMHRVHSTNLDIRTDFTHWNTGAPTGLLTGEFTALSENDDEFLFYANAITVNISDFKVELIENTHTDYKRKKYVSLDSTGTGYQQFKYPDITGYVNFVSVGGANTSITITPVVRGSIIDTYLYESGTGYGSTFINFEKKPIISLTNGIGANIHPIIDRGKIISLNVQYGGREYYTNPDLIVIDPTGLGNGAKLRPVIENGRIVDVKINNSGIGYSTSSSILVKSLGSNEFLNPIVRSFTIDNNKKLGKNLLIDGKNKLKYTICGYSTDFLDERFGASDIIGWAYDGNPIYGPYGYKNSDGTGNIVKLGSGYSDPVAIDADRQELSLINPYSLGYFVEDYQYNNSGDLDKNNGRYEINPDFPNGVYAYRALLDNNDNPVFPYFIGNTYRSNSIKDNFLDIDQSFDFNNSNLLRNTFPYKAAEIDADNDFLIETSEIIDQKIKVESVSSGSVSGFNIVSAGVSFRVNDTLNFDNTNTSGDGLFAKVSDLKGAAVTNLNTTIEEYDNSVVTWNNNEIKVSILPSHILSNNDDIILSGLSTDIFPLNSSYKIGVTSYTANCLSDIPASIIGFTTEIYVSNVPNNVSAGGSIRIGTETLKILNIYKNQNILTVSRGTPGISHTATSLITFVPDSFTVSNKIDYFDSKLNDKVYFNPSNSVGLGTTSGSGYPVSFLFGGNTITRNIPTRRIYLEDHPFVTNQKLTFTKDTGYANISISTSTDGNTFIMPSTVYAVKTSHNTIGIKTGIGTTGGNEVFFRSIGGGLGGDSDKYLFESNFNQVTAKVERVKTLVSTSSTHGLRKDDKIKLFVKPSLYTGIGTFNTISLSRESESGNILINPLTFGSSSVKKDKLNLNDHGFITGDKIYYSGNATGLSTGRYYVYKEDDDNIKLSETYSDVIGYNPTYVSITDASGSLGQKVYLINPQIKTYKNNNLVFDTSDSSLTGYDLKFYYDNEYKNEFNSSGITTTFDIVSTGSTTTISYGSSLPIKLYYNLEKSGYISTSDIDVINYSEILYVGSEYDGEYSISGIGTTSFNIFLNKTPEKLSYAANECDTLKYSTKSLFTNGPIDKINIFSPGSGYKSLPKYVGSSSTIGAKDAFIIPQSNTIGNIEKVRIINEGFEYSSDKTLQPKASISPILTLENANTIGIVTVSDGGSGYINPPDIIIVDTNTGLRVNKGYLVAEMNGTSISRVNIKEFPSGLPEVGTKIVAINNTNGTTIDRVQSNVDGKPYRFICQITTPTLNFPINPFNIGDEVFVEGIVSISTDGSGFNSSDYGYKFFKVVDIPSINPFKVKFDLSEFTTNVGIAKTVQDSYGSLINSSKYPSFEVHSLNSKFIGGEQIISNNRERNLFVESYSNNIMKVSGSYSLSVGDEIIGMISRNTGRITNVKENIGHYKVDFSVKKDIGWSDDVGKLSIDNQVTPDNDYYQNLSYTIKSPIQWKELQTPVNNILHTSGMKNFSDTGITSTASVSMGSSSATTVIYDVIEDTRVDTVYNLDMGRDIEISESGDTSKFIEFKTIRLSDYLDCRTNNVLTIDSIDKQFSNLEGEPSEYLNIAELGGIDIFDNYIIRISSNQYTQEQLQLTELILMNDGNNNVLFDKNELINSGIGFTSYIENTLGAFSIVEDKTVSFLRFIPKDPFNIDYDLKIIKSNYSSVLPGIGTVSLGSIDLTSSINKINAGDTDSVISVNSTKFGSLLVNSHVMDLTTNQVNFVESYITHDGTDTYVSEYFVDGSVENNGQIGNFTPNLTGQSLSLNYSNTTSNTVKVKSRIVGFGTVQSNDEFRFKAPLQDDGSERSAIYQGTSSTSIGSASTTVIGMSTSLFDGFKSLVEVSVGSSKAIHQLTGIQEEETLYLQQSHYLSIGNDEPTGLGTFGLSYNGSDFDLNFYPDDVGAATSIVSFNQSLYTFVDQSNTYNTFDYGRITDSVTIQLYNAINGKRINKSSFDLNYNSIPIFSKSFNPSDNNALDLSTGLFTIKDHFFRTGEKLNYRPDSTFAGVGATPMMYKSTVSGTLPSSVFAIRKTDDTFEIATTRALATAGTAITFTSVGEGNAHKFIMDKRNEKSIITIDGITQYPIAPTNISHNLAYNEGGQISASSTTFSLSGISSVLVGNVLKIDDEYTGIINVGIGTSTIGPITPGIGTYTLVSVKRGFVGTSATTHTNSTAANLFRGNYNIVDNQINFTDSPRGNPQGQEELTGLPFVRSKFTGRVFLRNDYSSNIIYDDISDQFTGLKTDFTLRVGGANTVGIGTSGGNGLLFINSIFQTPSTDNNPANNFKIIEDTSAGVSTVIFSGVTSTNGSLVQSVFDINQNQLPRGGVIISLGSTPGLGYAPLVGAKVKPVMNASGTITNVVGIATTGSALSISTAVYGEKTGILTITTTTPHDLTFGYKSVDEVRLVGLEFTCSSSYAGLTTTIFPETDNNTYPIVGVADTNIFSVDVGISTIAHVYVGQGTVYPWYGDLNFGSGYNNIVSIGVTIKDAGYEHNYIGVYPNSITVNANSIGANSFLNPDDATYNPVTGELVLIKANHNAITGTSHKTTTAYYDGTVGILTVTVTGTAPSPALADGQLVRLDNESFTFTCAKDNHATEHKYPRPSDPLSEKWVPISNVTGSTFEINVLNIIPSTNTGIHTFVGVSTFKRSANTISITDNSLTFTCSKDVHETQHTYPRATDPISVGGGSTVITGITTNSITINVGKNVGTNAVITANPVGFNTHQFVSASSNAIEIISAFSGVTGDLQPASGTSYNPKTGILSVTVSGHSLTTSDTVKFRGNTIVFKCAQDNYQTTHEYPRTSDPIYNTNISVGSTTLDTFELNVGKSTYGSGGALEFNIVNGGINYKRPEIYVSSPSYENLAIRGTSRLGVGNTTDTGIGVLLDVEVSPAIEQNEFFTHMFVSADDNSVAVDSWSGTKLTPNDVSYIPSTGVLTLGFAANHNLTAGSNTLGIATNSIGFKCSKDDYITIHTYPRTSDPIHNLSNVAIAATTLKTLSINVGKQFTGEVGIGSELFQVSNFKVARNGYAFQSGDKFEPVGLVTDRKLHSIKEKFELEVTQVFSDQVALWQFGELDFIDSIKKYQDGSRTRFPLFYNGSLISVESGDDFETDLSSVMVIMRNGVLQEPEEAYYFIGGTSINFTVPPRGTTVDEDGNERSGDNIAIFFYKGTDKTDAVTVTPKKSGLEIGDEIQLRQNPIEENSLSQDKRTVYSITQSDTLSTNLYNGVGIITEGTVSYKPVSYMKQKYDQIINSEYVYKTRDTLEPQIYPTAKIIGYASTSDNYFFVDDVSLFNYESEAAPNFGALIISGIDPISAAATATISVGGTVTGFTTSTVGSGYTSATVSIAAPPIVIDDNLVGVGTTATATATVSGGSISGITLTNPGLGYTIPPKVLISVPESVYENVTTAPASSLTIQGNSGIVTGITTTMFGANLAIEITGITTESPSFPLMVVGNPLYVYDTEVGHGVTSMDTAGTTEVGIGTTFADNIYTIAAFHQTGVAPNEVTGIITCIIKSDTYTSGLHTMGIGTMPVGKYSSGKISGFTRSSNPISIGISGYTINSGLTTFPTIQRRSGADTWEDTGAIDRKV